MDFLDDDKMRLQSSGWSGVVPVHLSTYVTAGRAAHSIGDKLGGGSIFKWLGVNERRDRIDVAYGDRNMLGDGEFGHIGVNGISGEFGVCTRW